MAQEFRPVQLNERDVLSFRDQVVKVSVFNSALQKALDRYLAEQLLDKIKYVGVPVKFTTEDYKDCFEEGMECEFLKVGDNWRKGKIRFNVTVELLAEEEEETPAPPENESPLDDIRRLMKDEN